MGCWMGRLGSDGSLVSLCPFSSNAGKDTDTDTEEGLGNPQPKDDEFCEKERMAFPPFFWVVVGCCYKSGLDSGFPPVFLSRMGGYLRRISAETRIWREKNVKSGTKGCMDIIWISWVRWMQWIFFFFCG